MKVGIYARVSTANNGQDPTMQTRELLEYCERRGWELAGEYVDVGICGAEDRRPQLDKLMADAHRRRFDVVAVWKFDRFARSVSHLLRALDTFRVLGIEFVSLSESLDTATPAGRMVFTVLGAVAELERTLSIIRLESGAAKRESQRKAPWPSARNCGRSQDWRAAHQRRVLGDGLPGNRTQSKGTAQRALHSLPKNQALAPALHCSLTRLRV